MCRQMYDIFVYQFYEQKVLCCTFNTAISKNVIVFMDSFPGLGYD